MINLKKITNKISSLKSVFTSAEKYNEIVDAINGSNDYLTFLQNKSIVACTSMGSALAIKLHRGIIFKRQLAEITVGSDTNLSTLLYKVVKNGTNTAKTITITQTVSIFLTTFLLSYDGYINNNYTYVLEDVSSFIGSTFSILLDNTVGTTNSNLTLALGADTGLTVNGSDSLVVSAGNVGKFEIVITSATTAKVCRVY